MKFSVFVLFDPVTNSYGHPLFYEDTLAALEAFNRTLDDPDFPSELGDRLLLLEYGELTTDLDDLSKSFFIPYVVPYRYGYKGGDIDA